jgi:hypothetical protein
MEQRAVHRQRALPGLRVPYTQAAVVLPAC